MANKKITDLTALATTPATGDLIEIVDVSDTTDAATGTNKKITIGNLTGSFGTLSNVVEDTTPQLGGDLDVNGNNITSTAGLNIAIGASAGNDFTVGTSKLVVEGDTGNVGIGTATPTGALEVSGDIYLTTNSDMIRLKDFETGVRFLGNDQIDFLNNGALSATFDASGGNKYFTFYDAASFTVKNTSNADVLVVNSDITLNPTGAGKVLVAKDLSLTSTSGTNTISIDSATSSDSIITFQENGTAKFSIGHDGSANEFVIARGSDLTTTPMLQFDESNISTFIGGVTIDQNGDGSVLSIDSEATTATTIDVNTAYASNRYGMSIVNGASTSAPFGVRWYNSISRYGFALGNGTTVYRFWVDDTGDLRIHSSDPTAHDNGTVVGTQT